MCASHLSQRKYEDEIESKKRHAAKLESSIRKMSDDLAKGNEIIQKLQGQIKNYHTKVGTEYIYGMSKNAT